MRKAFILGIVAGLLIAGCAGLSVRYFGLEGVVYEQGKLLGPEPKYDRPFSDCQPDSQFKHGKCVIMFYSDFKTFKTDYEDCKMRLDSCQRSCGGG